MYICNELYIFPLNSHCNNIVRYIEITMARHLFVTVNTAQAKKVLYMNAQH